MLMGEDALRKVGQEYVSPILMILESVVVEVKYPLFLMNM